MSTETTTPKLSPELQQRIQDNALKLNITNLRRKAEAGSASWSAAQCDLAGIVLLASLGIKEKAKLTDAIDIAIAKRDAFGYTMEAIESKLAEVVEKAIANKWGDLADMLPDEDAAKPKPEPRKKAVSSVTPRFNVELPTVIPGPAPRIAVTADPMSAMTAAIAAQLAPLMEHTALAQNAALMGKLQPVFEEIVRQVASTSSAPSEATVDEDKVKAIITKSLNNGVGEELRKLVASTGPKALVDVLEKAATAIASATPKTEETVKLSAAYEPVPDPNYAWSEDLEAVAEMLNQARQDSPENAMLVGPPGGGKTEFVLQFAAKFGLKVMVMDCANVREARDWFGQKGAANGSTYFRRSQFWMAVEAGNCVILLDEYNRAASHVTNPLMPILDMRRQSFVEEVGETLKVGPGTMFFATINEGLDCTGTHELDKAMKSRFPRRIEIGYLPEEKEIQVLCDKVDKLRKLDARKLVEIATTIRSKASTYGGGLKTTISTRQLIAAAKDFVRMGPRSFQYTLINHFEAEGGTDSERAQIIQTVEGKGFSLSAPASK